MPNLQFQCTYKSREGHAPNVNGWTYHHILPVRYYWSAAFILVKLLRLNQCRTAANPDLKIEFGDKNALDFLNDELDISNKDIKSICMSLHQNPNMGAEQQFNLALSGDLSSNEVIATAVAPLTGPRYGGFAGMKGSDQRSDDPGSRVEKKKPYSFNQNQWTHLQEVGKALERCMSKIATTSNGPYLCRVTASDARALLHHLRSLRACS
ncbi:MAG: hypothetical protein H6974_03905 [Gammaproteobacteria bacterium]|nr:hypothetical protein [Gammaproteobacteria bacterium]